MSDCVCVCVHVRVSGCETGCDHRRNHFLLFESHPQCFNSIVVARMLCAEMIKLF